MNFRISVDIAPHQVHELRVTANGDDLRTHFLETIVLLCQSSKFGRSDECEVGGVEEQESICSVT